MFPAAVESWRSLVKENARGLPVEFLLAWMRYESGGNPAALGAITEVGLFQIDMQDGPRFGGDLNTLHRNFAPATSQTASRALTLSEQLLQVTSGVAMALAYRDASRAKLAAIGADWPEGSADFWSLVKLHHGLPAIPRYFLPAFKAAKGRAPASWSEWSAWLNSLSYGQTAAINGASAAYYFPDGPRSKGPRKALGRFTSSAESSGQFGGVELVAGFVSVSQLLVLLAIGAALFLWGR